MDRGEKVGEEVEIECMKVRGCPQSRATNGTVLWHQLSR